jgi:pimeloyl-ACP methyl ester carboxylesterase
MAKIVGIHGAFHELWGPNQVYSRWYPAILDGLWHHRATAASDEFEVAFYGDVFRTRVDQGPPDDVELREVADRSGFSDVADALMGPGGIDVLAEIIGVTVARRLLHQLGRYFADDGVRVMVGRRLEATISDDTSVIIAHSMGSVVAYEWLCHNPDLPVRTLITLGSPLGGPFVQASLLPSARQGVRPWPAGLDSWVNVAAVGDSVVVESNLAKLFDGPVEDLAVDNGARTHDAEPYLNAFVTGAALAQALGRPVGIDAWT